MSDDRVFWTETCLHVSDVLWSCFLITPLTIFYWGGTWKLMDLYVYPGDSTISSVVSLVAGTVGCLAGYLLLPLLEPCRPPALAHNSASPCTWRSVKHVLVSRTCVYVLALSVLNYWRGVWNLLDLYVGTGPVWNGVCVGVSGVLLIALRALGNVVSAPFAIELDVSSAIYRPVTRFKVQPDRFWAYLCDSVFSHLVINHLVVQVWRGLWNLMERAILPGDVLLSYCVSLGAGFGGAFILFILQHPLTVAANRLMRCHWTAMLTLQEVVHLAGVVVTLLVWRGGWGLNRDYLLHNTLEAAVAHGLGSAGLLLCQSLTSVSTLDIGVDGENHSSTGFYYSIHYFWHFWKQRRPAVVQVQVEQDSANRGLLEDSDDDLINPS